MARKAEGKHKSKHRLGDACYLLVNGLGLYVHYFIESLGKAK